MTTERNAQGVDGLAEVMVLLEKATPGEWDAKADENDHGGWKPATQEVSIYSGKTLIAHYSLDYDDYPQDNAENAANAEAIAAAVNYLRSHGAAIAELIAAADYVAAYMLSYSAIAYSPTACKEARDRLNAALRQVEGQ